MSPLLLTLNELPPSVNSMYVHTRHGPRLTPEARQFFARAHMALAAQIALATKLDPGQAYQLILRFRLPELENAGWPNTKTRFKGRDVSNLIKVVEDVVAGVIGVNDANFLGEQVHKVWAEQPGVDIVVGEYLVDGQPYTRGVKVPRMAEPWNPCG